MMRKIFDFFQKTVFILRIFRVTKAINSFSICVILWQVFFYYFILRLNVIETVRFTRKIKRTKCIFKINNWNGGEFIYNTKIYSALMIIYFFNFTFSIFLLQRYLFFYKYMKNIYYLKSFYIFSKILDNSISTYFLTIFRIASCIKLQWWVNSLCNFIYFIL